LHRLLLLLLCLLFSWYAMAGPDVRPAVIYDRPSKFDQSFSQAVFTNGVLALRQEGFKVKEFEPARGAQIEQAMIKLARRGYQPIIGIGYATAPAIEKVATLFPQQAFVIIDSVVDLPNVQSILFREEQGTFLAGALAALATSSNTIGFIGGMDIGLIAKFSCGYIQGARYVAPDIKVLKNYIGSTLNAWNDPSKRIELAKSQIERGADVLFAAAGGSGSGVYLAAHEAGILAIGVDSNQNALQPGNMLSSMVKRVGLAVYQSVKSFQSGQWHAGRINYDLSNNGLELVRDADNQWLYLAEYYQQIQAIKQQIISGAIIIDDHESGCR
jgi:basic membrane protein A and related proteins